MNVYWSPIIMKPVFTGEGMSHLRVPEPTLASNILKGTFDENNRSSNFMKCPSFNKQQKNVYALKFGYTYGFEINKGNVKTEFYDQSFFNDTILLRDPKNKILSLGRMGYIFISETSLEIDLTGAYLDNNDFVNKTTVIPGSFDIGKWFRPLELGFIIKNDEITGLSGFFASNRKGGKGGDDLYAFNFKNDPGLKTFSLGGKVVNLKNKAGIKGAQVSLLNRQGDVIKEVASTADGSFRVEVPWMSQITIQAMSEGYSIFSTTYSEEGMEEIQNASYNMGLSKMEDLVTEIEEKTVLKLNKFYFDKGKSTLNPQVEAELNKVVDAVVRFPQMRLRIQSHTDSRGSNSYNKKLSQQRADTIKDFLLKNGLNSSNIIEATGYGEEMIVNNCKNGAYCLDFLHKQNERTMFVVE